MAEFKRPCSIHCDLICTLFCTVCNEFKCSKCIDEHMFSGKMLPEWLIEKYIYDANSKVNKVAHSTIEACKTEITQIYTEYMEKIKKQMEALIALYDMFDQTQSNTEEIIKKLNNIGVSEVGYAKLNACADKYKKKLGIEIEVPNVDEYDRMMHKTLASVNMLPKLQAAGHYFDRNNYLDYIESIPRICLISDTSVGLFDPRNNKFTKMLHANCNMQDSILVGDSLYCFDDHSIYSIVKNSFVFCEEMIYEAFLVMDICTNSYTYDRIFIVDRSAQSYQYNITGKCWNHKLEIKNKNSFDIISATALIVSKYLYLLALGSINKADINTIDRIEYNTMNKWESVKETINFQSLSILKPIKVTQNEQYLLICNTSKEKIREKPIVNSIFGANATHSTSPFGEINKKKDFKKEFKIEAVNYSIEVSKLIFEEDTIKVEKKEGVVINETLDTAILFENKIYLTGSDKIHVFGIDEGKWGDTIAV